MSGDQPADPGNEWDKHLENTLKSLQKIYHTYVEPVEKKFEYDTFRPSWFGETIVQKKPFITFLGPFSAGKSTFINYLMQSNYLLTGPQPVTDKFTVIMHGDEIQQIPGSVLVADSSQPFRGLQQFGASFIDCFQGVLAPHPILRSVSMIDTPGILEAAGDIHQRRYPYIDVCRWFVEKSDLVFFLFDPSKLDSGRELQELFKAMRGFENKIRIILNKADSVGPQELMRVYGSLFWSLASLIQTTEPPRVYVSSFWDRPYKPGTNHNLFTDEKSDLLYDLIEVVPTQSLDKRVTTVLKRCQQVLIHVLVVASVRSKMPKLWGKDKALKETLAKLPELYRDLAAKWRLAENDFTDPEEYVRFFAKFDVTKFPDMQEVDKKQFANNLKKLIDTELPNMLKPIKTGSTVDPRDRKHAINLQRNYQASLQAQLEGQSGVQGGMGNMVAPAHMQGLMATPQAPAPAAAPATMDPQQQALLLQMQMMQAQQAQAGGLPQASVQVPAVQPTPAPAPAAGAAPQMTQEQMMQMMAMMQAQQAQQAQQQ